MLFCLLIVALIGALIGFLIGRILKCKETSVKEKDIKPFDDLKEEDEKILKSMFLKPKVQKAEIKKVVENDKKKVDNSDAKTLLNMAKQESDLEIKKSKKSKKSKELNFLDTPRNGKSDDLKEISGIGLKLEKVLNDLGIYHFDQIASWGEKELDWIDEHLNTLKAKAMRENWIEQAKILAEGGMIEFSKIVEKDEIDR
jgi:predicted flap endonuclease-1-like 5' DNA nuclease